MKQLTNAAIICFLSIFITNQAFSKDVENSKITIKSHISEDPQNPFEVYNSMARALKYNIDSAIITNNQKIIELKEAKTPKEKLSIFVSQPQKQTIFSSYQTLSAAILIAKDQKDAYYQELSQNLLLAGASAYNKASFAKSQGTNLKRTIKNQQIELDKINKKEASHKLSQKDEKRKEVLELYLLKAQRMQEKYNQDIAHFENLESLNAKYVNFGSKKYFHGKNFKQEFELAHFENLAQENGIIQNLEETKSLLAKKFPHAYRMQMDANAYKNKPLQQEIIKEAKEVSKSLLNKEISINQAKLLQIKLAYNIVKLTQFIKEEANQKYLDAYKEYNKTKKDRSLKNEELIAKAKVLQTAYENNNLQGRLALAIQNLYFLVDPINISKQDLQKAVGRIAKDIKKYTTKNPSVLMATKNYAITIKEPMPAINKKPQWADPSSDWLSNIIDKAN